MASESKILQGILAEEPELDPTQDAADAVQRSSEGLNDADGKTIETEDGGAVIEMGDAEDVARNTEFFANLAEEMEPGDLLSIGASLTQEVERDIQDRKDRDTQYEKAIKETGMVSAPPGGATFTGASRASVPLLAEVGIDFAARAIKELWPAEGPVKDKVIGDATKQKESKAKRKKQYMNWQLTEQMPTVRDELEQILSQLPLAGVAYSKLRWEVQRKKPVHEIVWADNYILPASATNAYNADRKTHRLYLTTREFQARVASGMYLDVATPTSMQPEVSAAQDSIDKVQGVEPNPENQDGVRLLYEVDTYLDFPDPKRKMDSGPYLVTIDVTTNRVLSVYRNWDPNDEHEENLIHVIEWPFLPWRGSMPIGMYQVAGGLIQAATGALRSLLDSAHINNFPGGMRLKSGPVGGQNVDIDTAEVTELEGGVNQDDIRKTFMPIPVNPTSPVLMQLLGWVVQSVKEVIKTTLDEANDNSNVPVGTIMARIEQGLVVFSAIHARLHAAMAKFLKVLHRLDATWLDDEDIVAQTGEQMTFKADFDAPNDVVPVSDPEIFSELQRNAQINMIAQRAQLMPQLYDQHKVEEAILKHMRIKDATQFLKPAPEPKPMNAVNENIAASLGQPIVAFPDQNHLMHIQEHLKFLTNPIFGSNPLMAAQAIPAILQNVKEHILFWYGTQIHSVASEAAGKDITEFMSIPDAETATRFDAMLAAAGKVVSQQAQQQLGGVMPVIQQLQGTLKQFSPPPPMDPSAVAAQQVQVDAQRAQTEQQTAQANAQNASAETALKQQSQQQEFQLQTLELQQKQQQAQMGNQTEVQKAQLAAQSGREDTATQADAHLQATRETNSTKAAVTQADNDTAMQIAAAEIAAGKHTNIKNGEAVGKKETM